jgi:hypothetical protein
VAWIPRCRFRLLNGKVTEEVEILIGAFSEQELERLKEPWAIWFTLGGQDNPTLLRLITVFLAS